MTLILPQGEQQFIDGNGVPLALGWVYFYVPSTTTPKATWQDQAQSVLNTNPIHLDGAGRAIIWGNGLYRQILQDSLLNTVWDQVVASGDSAIGISWGGVGGGTANAQTATVAGYTPVDGAIFEYIPGVGNTSSTTIAVNGGIPKSVLAPGTTGPVPCNGGELTAGNVVQLLWYQTLGSYIIVNQSIAQFNALAQETVVAPTDYQPFYSIADSGNRKALISDWLKVLAGLTAYTSPVAGDSLAIYSVANAIMMTLAAGDLFKVIHTLDDLGTPDPNNDQIVIYSAADNAARKASLAVGTGLWRYIGTQQGSNGTVSVIFKDLDAYRVVNLILTTCTPQTNDSQLQLQISTDNGATWIAAGYLNDSDPAKVDALWLNDGGASHNVSGSTNDGGLNGNVMLSNVGLTANMVASGNTAWKEPGANISQLQVAGMADGSGNPINAIKLSWLTGNFKRGRVYLEGILA